MVEDNSDFEEIDDGLTEIPIKAEEEKGEEFAFEEILDEENEKKEVAFEELVDEAEKSSGENIIQEIKEESKPVDKTLSPPVVSLTEIKEESKPEILIREEVKEKVRDEVPELSRKTQYAEKQVKTQIRDQVQIKTSETKPKGASLPIELSKKVDRVMIVSAIVAIICHFVGAREVALDWYMLYVYKMKFPFQTFSYDATIRLILLSIVFIWGTYVYNKVRVEISGTEKSNMNMVLVGVILIVVGPVLLIPLERLSPDLPISYYILPWPVFNSLMFIIGLVIVGAYVLWSKEEGGGVFTWLIGVFILFLLPIHRMFHFAPLEVWQLQTYDQIIGAVGECLIAISFVMVRRRRGMANDAKKAYELGNALSSSGRYAEALDAYDDAIQILHNLYAHRLDTYISKGIIDVPEEYVTVWISKGATLLKLGKFRKALAHFDIALSIDPKNKYALNLRGESLLKLNRLDEARECFERALEIDGEYKEAEQNLIEIEKILIQQGNAN